eukprot:TRINITY_DN5299_c0_g1_i1.p1 TRINITY_DN5299_c0_g1~~TRINITY_DN5299_c0_g1_i1.p1  ORF type:complete len:335 (-),score=146.88 TRINITY_DN5299_c0_g1_i1:49-1053(-)
MNEDNNDPPKKPPTAYIIWSNVIREQIQKETKGDFAHVGRELGKRWKNLSKQDKEPFIRQAAQKQINYAKAVSSWIFKNPGRKNEILEETTSVKKRKKTSSSVSNGTDPNKKKKKEKMVPTGFQIFQREQRPIIRQNYSKNLSNKESFGLVSKQVSSNWKNLTPTEKEKYNREAAQKIALMEQKEIANKSNPTPNPNNPNNNGLLQNNNNNNFMNQMNSKNPQQQVPPKFDPNLLKNGNNTNLLSNNNNSTLLSNNLNFSLSKPNIQLNHPHIGSLHHPQLIQHPLLNGSLPNKVYHPNLIPNESSSLIPSSSSLAKNKIPQKSNDPLDEDHLK